MVKQIKLLWVAWITVVFASCNGFLEVGPKDRYLQETVFADTAATELARKGIYTQLASDALYGGTLTMGALDMMAQYYAYDANHNMVGFALYDYADARVATTFAQTWETAYNTILNINSFIAGLKSSKSDQSAGARHRYLGEAYGLRAYLHFDLLRLFGPVYREYPDSTAIPYTVAPTNLAQPLLSAKETALRVLADLDSAGQQLSAAGEGLAPGEALPTNRFGYRALLATKARVSWYVGDREQASVFAQQALDAGTDDLIFSLPVPTMAQQYERYFSPTVDSYLRLSPPIDVLAEIYGRNSNDTRFRSNWAYYPHESERIAIFSKYAPPVSAVPLARAAELYYILAAGATNKEQAESYLRQVGRQRGEEELPGSTIAEKIALAYRREFWGEGQLFYFYKRNFQQQLPDASGLMATVVLNADDYQVPLPKEELIYR